MPTERKSRRNRQKRRKQQAVNMMVVYSTKDFAIDPVVSKDFHKFEKLIFKLHKQFEYGLWLSRRARRVHYHFSLGFVELAELNFAGIVTIRAVRIFTREHILNHRRRHSCDITRKRFIRQESVFRLLDFLDKRILAIRRHKRLATALEHCQKRYRKEIRIFAMQNPRCIFTSFKVITHLGNIAHEIAPGFAISDKRSIRARILFQITYRNV